MNTVQQSYQNVTRLAILLVNQKYFSSRSPRSAPPSLFLLLFATSLDFSFSMCPIHKQGMKHMDLITRAMIHVHFHLIRNSSGRPKNSFWLYIILKESTHMSFREKIIKFKRQKPAQTCQLQWLVTRKKSMEFRGHLGFVMCAEAAPTVISTTLNGLMTSG